MIYSQNASNTNVSAVLLGEGSKDILFRTSNDPRITVLDVMPFAKMKIVLNLQPLEAIKMINRNTLPDKKHIHIPPDWAFGLYHLMRGFKD